jgi:hypothetical protein
MSNPTIKPKAGNVPMMIRPVNSANYHLETYRGFVIGQFGIAQNPHDGDRWSVTHLGTGKAIRDSIQKRRDAMQLLIAVDAVVGNVDITNLGSEDELANKIKGIVYLWGMGK